MHNVTIERATMRGIVSAMSRDKKKEWMQHIHVQEDRGERYMIATNGFSLHYVVTGLNPGVYNVLEVGLTCSTLERIEPDFRVSYMAGTITQCIKSLKVNTGPISSAAACGIAGYLGVVVDPKLIALAVGRSKDVFLGIADEKSPIRVWNRKWHAIIMPIRCNFYELSGLKKEMEA